MVNNEYIQCEPYFVRSVENNMMIHSPSKEKQFQESSNVLILKKKISSFVSCRLTHSLTLSHDGPSLCYPEHKSISKRLAKNIF